MASQNGIQAVLCSCVILCISDNGGGGIASALQSGWNNEDRTCFNVCNFTRTQQTETWTMIPNTTIKIGLVMNNAGPKLNFFYDPFLETFENVWMMLKSQP